jgi:hypothetical protein
MNDEEDWVKAKNLRTKQQRIVTSTPSNNHPAASLLALHNTARTRTFRTHTPLRGATNCTHQKEKERHPKVGALFFSPKALKARARGKEKARVNRAMAKAIAREKA